MHLYAESNSTTYWNVCHVIAQFQPQKDVNETVL